MALEPEDVVEVGTAVNGSQAESVGTVVEVLTDPHGGRATWAWVAVGHAHGMVRAVPLGSAVRTAGGVTVPFRKAFVTAAPEAVLPSGRADLPAAVVTGQEDRLAAYYGLSPTGPTPARAQTDPSGTTRGGRPVFLGLLAVGLVRGVVGGVRSAFARSRS